MALRLLTQPAALLRLLIATALLAAIAGLSALTSMQPALAAISGATGRTGPVLVAGNPTCPEGYTEIKVESPGTSFSGSAGGATVTGTLNGSQTTITSFTL